MFDRSTSPKRVKITWCFIAIDIKFLDSYQDVATLASLGRIFLLAASSGILGQLPRFAHLDALRE
jgi:hypothetical protein